MGNLAIKIGSTVPEKQKRNELTSSFHLLQNGSFIAYPILSVKGFSIPHTPLKGELFFFLEQKLLVTTNSQPKTKENHNLLEYNRLLPFSAFPFQPICF